MIVTVTLNPCLDKTLVVDPWEPGQNVRAWGMSHVAGGKGNNTARVLKTLGYHAKPVTLLGGWVGRHLAQLFAERDGLDPLVVWTQAPTRIIVTIRTGDTAQQSAFFDPNPDITPEESGRLRDAYRDLFRGEPVEMVVMGGSAPCAALDDCYQEMIRVAQAHDVPTVLDTYGDALPLGLGERPTFLKVNAVEAAGLLDQRMDTPAERTAALDRLMTYGCQYVVITLGPDGVVAAHGSLRLKLNPPPITLVNPIASGDAMSAGLVHAYLSGMDPADVFRWGVAAGTANAAVWDAGSCTRQQIEHLLPGVSIQAL